MAESQSTPFSGMELETALRGPDGKATADRLIARIDQLAQELEAYKRSGLTTPDYSRVETINKALAAARGIVLAFTSSNPR